MIRFLTTWLVLCVLTGITFAQVVKAESWNGCDLTDNQYSVLHFSYSYGRSMNIGYSMAAIAMAESRLGKWNINIQDPSGSPWHITLDKYLDYRGWDDTGFNLNRAAHDLMNDYYAGAHIASQEILYWYGRYDNVYGHERWRRTWASYNTGNGWDSKRGRQYAKTINNHIRTIRQCGWIREG